MDIRDATRNDIALLAQIIAESNRDVAERFGLNKDNCPKHPSLCTEDWVLADFARGERYFILQDEGSAIGCVAYENPSEGLAYLNRLSVLPGHRQRGAGAQLVGHVIDLAQSSGIETISIGIIAENEELKRWYIKLGFIEGETRTFPHLPFTVGYLHYEVQPSQK